MAKRREVRNEAERLPIPGRFDQPLVGRKREVVAEAGIEQ